MKKALKPISLLISPSWSSANESLEFYDRGVRWDAENINIKGSIFGIDYFESKSGYKIITLKVMNI
mgnify:CR=1 FL=1